VQIIHLSDLHFAAKRNNRIFWKYFHPFQNFDARRFPEINVRRVFEYIAGADVKPDHIIITGDITTTAHEDEFKIAKKYFLNLQKVIKSGKSIELPTDFFQEPELEDMDLDKDLFSVLPGNHDVVGKSKGKGRYKKLGLFMKYFGSTIDGFDRNNSNYDRLFPYIKHLSDDTDLIGINSTGNISVQYFGWNAIGKIDDKQLDKMVDLLGRSRASYKIVSLHHHPMLIPYDDKYEIWMALKKPNRFLNICYDNGVNLILHGHKHRPFLWENYPKIPEQDPSHQISILSASATSVKKPNAKAFYNFLTSHMDERGKTYYKLSFYVWNSDDETFYTKPGPYLGHKGIVEFIDEYPRIMEEIKRGDEHYRSFLKKAEKVFLSAQNFNYQYREIHATYHILNNRNLKVTKKIRITGSMKQEFNPISMIRLGLSGNTPAKYRDINLTVKSLDDAEDIIDVPCVDKDYEKRVILFFSPPIKDDKDVREFEYSYEWPNFWSDLFEKGEDSLKDKPLSEGKIEKLQINLVIENGLPEMTCEQVQKDGKFTGPFMDSRNNKCYQWTIVNAAHQEYRMRIHLKG